MRVIIENDSTGLSSEIMYNNVSKITDIGCVNGVMRVTLVTEDGRKLTTVGNIKMIDREDSLREGPQTDEWFGVVRWCREDIEGQLIDKGVISDDDLNRPDVVELVDCVVDRCRSHHFTDCMISNGWEVVDSVIDDVLGDRLYTSSMLASWDNDR